MFETEIDEELENKEVQKEIIEDYLMSQKPKGGFKEIFATLKKEQQENIYDEFLNNLNKNNQEYKNDMAVGLITSGYFFLYKQNNHLYIGVPKEIIYLKKKISENDMAWMDDESLFYDDYDAIFDENEALPF